MPASTPPLRAWALPVNGPHQAADVAPLPQGMHVRWAFERERGFPWGGFYVLRRVTRLGVAGGRPTGRLTAGGGGPTAAPAPGPWSPLPGLVQPVCLPLRSADYPASQALAWPPGLTDLAAGKWLAERRLIAEPSDAKAPLLAAFGELTGVLRELTNGGPNAAPMAERLLLARVADSVDPASTVQAPDLGPTSPLDLALLGVAYPIVARLLGLYAIDAGLAPDVRADYLVLADHAFAFCGDIHAAVAWAAGGCAPQPGLDVAMIEGVEATPCGTLPPPSQLWAYELPIPRAAGIDAAGKPTDRVAAVGLCWQAAAMPSVVGAEPPLPALFRVARAALGAAKAADLKAPATAALPELLKAPWTPLQSGQLWHLAAGTIALAGTEGEYAEGTTRPDGWPPWRLPYIDAEAPAGWSAYRVRAMDWFGRVSTASAPAQWRRWPWVGPGPAPWAFAFAKGYGVIRDDAVLLVDRVAPPAPAGIEVTPVDPKDALLLDQGWYTAHKQEVDAAGFGARVRWRWTQTQRRQAPTCAQFRVYQRKGVVNSVPLELVSATDLAPGRVQVVAVPAAAMPADPGALVNCTLRLGGSGGTIDKALAFLGKWTFVVAIPSTKTANDIRADGRLTLLLRPGAPGHASARDVRSSGWQRAALVDVGAGTLGFEVYRQNDGAAFAGDGAVAVKGGYHLPGTVPLEGVMPGLWQLRLTPPQSANGATVMTFDIVAVDLDTRRVQVQGPLEGGKATVIDGAWRWALGQRVWEYERFLPLGALVPEPSAAVGKSWFQVAVTAADSQALTLDWLTTGPNANQPGNEGEPAGPSAGWRVRRTPPAVPEALWGDDDLTASRPDVEEASYVTVRWKDGPVAVQVWRAVADAVWRAHWDAGAVGLPAAALAKAKAAVPGAVPGAKDGKLPVGASFAAISAIYDGLSVQERRAIASSAGAESAFAPVTAGRLVAAMQPDVVGPDAAVGYVPSEKVRAFVDRLDGSVRGRYYYRLQAVDAAGLVSGLGAASGAVVVPVVVRPGVPVILGVARKLPLEFAGLPRPAWWTEKVVELVDKGGVGLVVGGDDGVVCWEVERSVGGVETVIGVQAVWDGGRLVLVVAKEKDGMARFRIRGVCGGGVVSGWSSVLCYDSKYYL